jgi:hypothetical protein
MDHFHQCRYFGGGGRVCWHPLSELLGAQLWARITCPIIGVVQIGCWLFSVKGYIVDRGTISVKHPLWSDRFEVRGLAPEDRRPGKDSIRVFASNWIFGHSLGLCYNRKISTFFVYMTNPKYRLDVETGKGVLVISPLDKTGLSSALGSDRLKASSEP